MRKESVTVQKCKKQMASLGFDKQALEWPALWFYNSFGATPYH